MTEQPAPHGPTTTLPPPSPPKSGPMHTRISGMRTSRAVGALLMAAAGTTRITRLRQIMRRDWRKPPTS
jgi:hypothetical protein